jgi:hypothetical protein
MVAWLENGQGYFTFEDVKKHPVVQQMINKYIPKHREEMALSFFDVWSKHFDCLESIERKYQFSLDNIQKIEWDGLENCFKVYYKKTKNFSAELYHYTLDGKCY